MSEPSPAPAEKTVVVKDPAICRLKCLTYISLGLNGLILLLFVIGAICHHHEKERGRFGDRDRGGWGRGMGMREDCPFLRHLDRMDRGPRDFGDGPDRMRGGPRDGGPGMMPGGPGFGGPGGMMGGPKGPPPDPAKMADGMLNMLSNKLTLTDDQKAKLKPIIADQVAQMQKQMDAQRAAMQKQFEDGKAKIKPLLNADQQKQLDAMPMPGQRPPPPLPNQVSGPGPDPSQE